MNKYQLKKELKAIKDNYLPLNDDGEQILNNKNINKYVDCLDNPDLKTHLLEIELAPGIEEAELLIQDYSTAEGIAECFQDAMYVIEELGLIQKKEDTELIKKENEYREYMSETVTDDVSSAAAMTISQLYDHISFTNNEVEIKGLDTKVIDEVISKQEKLLLKGDMVALESMLHSQVHTLNAMFATLVGKMANSKQLEQVEAFGKLALKSQNQCRQSLSTLSELMGLKKTVFIHQNNTATNQQINNTGARENLNDTANGGFIHVDRGSTTSSQGEVLSDKTVALQDTGEQQNNIDELLQTRNEISQDERAGTTISSTEQATTKSKKVD